MDLIDQLKKNMAKSPDYEDDSSQAPPFSEKLVRLIAYYLPQFHPIQENNEWWGDGFTEWSNVTKALPRFHGHYQPHLPGGLGFYDLRLTETLRNQAKLAKKYGISGFCFHHYWFDGKPLLETPIEILLKSKDIDIGFCINWANESWVRSWDGNEKDALISQNHSPEDDLAFAHSLKRFFSDNRYIRINNRPLLMVYRPSLFPDAAETLNRWRDYFHQSGMENPYIVMPQAFNDNDPRKYGFDAAAGFPPHNGGWGLQNIRSSLISFKPWNQEKVSQYERLMENMILNNPEEFTLLPGVCPSWDNTARREKGGTCFVGSSPKKYAEWLLSACERVLKNPNEDERIVFINAWNEWAEGAHLEPDTHYGYAFLAETSRVLLRLGLNSNKEIIRRPFLQIQHDISNNYALDSYEKKPFLIRLIRRAFFAMSDVCESAGRYSRSLGNKFH